MAARTDYKSYAAQGRIKHYINVGKFWKGIQGQKWKSLVVTDYGPPLVYTADPYNCNDTGGANISFAYTNHRVETGGYTNTDIVAQFDVTYYVQFKGIRI